MISRFRDFFYQGNVLFIFVQFERDRICPRESAKMDELTLTGQNAIFLNSELIFEIYDKNYLGKKNSCLYDPFKFS